MAKTYKVTMENSLEIREAMKKRENAKYYKRLMAVALRGEGKKNAEIAQITKYHATSKWILSLKKKRESFGSEHK